MKTYTKTFHGVEVKAYSDSNSEWVVKAEGSEIAHRFDKRKWAMKDGMELAARMAA